MKRLLILALVSLLLILSGCGSKVPEYLKNPKTDFVQVEDYQRPQYEIPSNYRLIQKGIYALLDENNNITGYMKLIEENGAYHWEQCGAEEAYQ